MSYLMVIKNHDTRRAEVAIADHVLNRMNDLGRPKSVRVS